MLIYIDNSGWRRYTIDLTNNGGGEYVNLNRKDSDKMRAAIALMSKLEEGEKSAREQGWLSPEEVETELEL